MVNSTDVIIHRPKVYDCWGDGIYVGVEYWGEFDKQLEDVTVYRPYVSRARRNGISVTSGRGVHLVRPVVEDVVGTAPQAGIDFEPEGKEPPRQSAKIG